jgi:D-aminopeptidase
LKDDSGCLALRFNSEEVDNLFEELDQCQLPGLAVGIAIDGRPVYRKGFGLASMELPVALSPSIKMRVFSITKHFTSLAYMLLCEEGKAGIDDSVGKYLTHVHPVARSITMRQLMGNISGLRDVFDINWQFNGTGRSISCDEMLSLYCSINDLNAPPGTAWIYNNGGFLLLGAVIERLSSMSLEEVMRTRIFDRVGMNDTMLRRSDADFVPNSASLHMTDATGRYVKNYIGGDAVGEGGMVSTVDDMLRWINHMNAPVVGSAATWAVMKSPQRLQNGTCTHYGLGLFNDRYRGLGVLYHPGGGMGGNSQMLKVPLLGLDIVVLVNREDISAMSLTNRILDLSISGLTSTKPRAKSKPMTGFYRSTSTDRTIQLLISDGRQIASIDGLDISVESNHPRELCAAGDFEYTKQVMKLSGDSDTALSIRLAEFGNCEEFLRQAPATEVSIGARTGLYVSETTGVRATILQSNGAPRMATVGHFGTAVYDLACVADGVWRARSKVAFWLGGTLTFNPDSSQFRFTTSRTRSLPFSRVS